MSRTPDSDNKPPDPFDQWRAMREAYMEALSKALNEAVKTDSYAQTPGALLELVVTASTPFREALQKMMTALLEQLMLPTREDFAALSDRFTRFESRLDSLDAKLDHIEKLLSHQSGASKPKRHKQSPVPRINIRH